MIEQIDEAGDGGEHWKCARCGSENTISRETRRESTRAAWAPKPGPKAPRKPAAVVAEEEPEVVVDLEVEAEADAPD